MTVKKPKAIFVLSILSLLAVLITGCWSMRELDELSIVAGMGVDLDPKKEMVLLTAQIIVPSAVKGGGNGGGEGSQGGQNPMGQTVRIATSAGATVFRAVRNFVPEASRRLYFPHNQVIIVGKEAAQQGISPLLDFFIRNHEPRPFAKVLIAQDSAYDILKASAGIENIPAFGIKQLLEVSAQNAYAIDMTLQDLTQLLMSPTTAPVAPIAALYQETQMGGSKVTRVKIQGTAVFKGDKLVGELTPSETRGLLWILGKVKTGIVTVPCSSNSAEYDSLEVTGSNSKIVPEIRDGKIIIKIELTVDSNLSEQQCLETIVDQTTLSKFEQLQAEAVKKEIAAVLETARRLNADIFGFGDEVHRKYPHQWPQLEPIWDELFPQIETPVTVRSRVHDVGYLQKPAL